MSNTATLGYQWALKGQQPVVPCSQKHKERLTAFGSYNYKTGQITVNFAPKGNSLTFIQHLKKVLKTYPKDTKIIMVLDNVRYHHSKKVKNWVEKRKNRIELFFLPPYSPNLNPIERAWWYMRKKITHNRYLPTLKQRKTHFWQLFSHFLKPNTELKQICELNY